MASFANSSTHYRLMDLVSSSSSDFIIKSTNIVIRKGAIAAQEIGVKKSRLAVEAKMRGKRSCLNQTLCGRKSALAVHCKYHREVQ